MTLEEIMLHIEAIIFASEKPITVQEMEQCFTANFEQEEITQESILRALDAVCEKYTSNFYPFEVKAVGGGYQFLTKKSFYPFVSKIMSEKFIKKLSTSSMETLAIIAYKQPITKADIEYVRGVNSDYSVQKLLEKELIVISGRLEDAVGKPLTYSTSRNFSDYLGINSLSDLPQLKEMNTTDNVIPTDATEAQLIVSNTGTLVEINKPTA